MGYNCPLAQENFHSHAEAELMKLLRASRVLSRPASSMARCGVSQAGAGSMSEDQVVLPAWT